MKVIRIDEIRDVVAALDPVAAIERAFAAYSLGQAVVPPVGEMVFSNPPGDVHIKYGYMTSDEYYVIKIASGFYDNPALGLPSGNGLMLLFSRKTGEGLAVLLDEGYLTDIRTAAAGAVAARYLAPRAVERIGIIGSGTQARLQLRYLSDLTGCREVVVWGRTVEHVARYRDEMEAQGFGVEIAGSPGELASKCKVIVTTTPATEPLLGSVREGTHITAVGSDSPGKQELDASILAGADIVVADSISQCLERGEISHAIRAGLIAEDGVVELGRIIAGEVPGRTSIEQITVADLTGVAVQDIAITRAVYEAVLGREK